MSCDNSCCRACAACLELTVTALSQRLTALRRTRRYRLLTCRFLP
ncbi:hypothetical protein [Planktotalea sp.]